MPFVFATREEGANPLELGAKRVRRLPREDPRVAETRDRPEDVALGELEDLDQICGGQITRPREPRAERRAHVVVHPRERAPREIFEVHFDDGQDARHRTMGAMRPLAFVPLLLLACGGSARPATPPPSPLPTASASSTACAAVSSDVCPVTPESASLPPVSRPPRVQITFELLTPGAVVRLVRDADERVVPEFPIRIGFDTSQHWEVLANKPGYCPLTQPVDFDHPTMKIELHRGCP